MKRGRVRRAGTQEQTQVKQHGAKLEAAHPTGTWNAHEHDRFLDAMKLYPKGPWKAIADHVGTRSVRQVQTHAQKYQEKLMRRMRGLRKPTRARTDGELDIGHRLEAGTIGKLRRSKRVNEGDEPGDQGEDDVDARDTQTDTESARADASSSDESDIAALTISEGTDTVVAMERALPLIGVDLDLAVHEGASFTAYVSPIATSADPTVIATSSSITGWPLVQTPSSKTVMLSLLDEEAGGLPTLSESLDFFIEYMST